jgi:hypothetical protein
MKLIHSGKVLKDEDVIESCNIKPNDFLVVMIAKVSHRQTFIFFDWVVWEKFVARGRCVVAICSSLVTVR